MSAHAVLGPIDPQIAGMPAASIIKVSMEKPLSEIDDQTLILADIGQKAIDQLKHSTRALLSTTMSAGLGRRARRQAHQRPLDARLPHQRRRSARTRPQRQHRHAHRNVGIDDAFSTACRTAGRRRIRTRGKRGGHAARLNGRRDRYPKISRRRRTGPDLRGVLVAHPFAAGSRAPARRHRHRTEKFPLLFLNPHLSCD